MDGKVGKWVVHLAFVYTTLVIAMAAVTSNNELFNDAFTPWVLSAGLMWIKGRQSTSCRPSRATSRSC
jgi:hypothetical protein